jgi:hypothetical protein
MSLEWLTDSVEPHECIYVLLYRNGRLKFGLSKNGTRRISEQTWSIAAELLGMDDMKAIISDEQVAEIDALELLALNLS